MTADELYNLIKRALNYFDLRWDQKHEITVSVTSDSVVFTYANESLTWKMPK